MHSPPDLAGGCAVPPAAPSSLPLHSPGMACWPVIQMSDVSPSDLVQITDLETETAGAGPAPPAVHSGLAFAALQPSRRLQIAVLLSMCTVMQTVLVVPTFILLTGATEQLAFCFCSSSGPIKLLGSITGPCSRASPGQGVDPPALPLGLPPFETPSGSLWDLLVAGVKEPGAQMFRCQEALHSRFSPPTAAPDTPHDRAPPRPPGTAPRPRP